MCFCYTRFWCRHRLPRVLPSSQVEPRWRSATGSHAASPWIHRLQCLLPAHAARHRSVTAAVSHVATLWWPRFNQGSSSHLLLISSQIGEVSIPYIWKLICFFACSITKRSRLIYMSDWIQTCHLMYFMKCHNFSSEFHLLTAWHNVLTNRLPNFISICYILYLCI
jgi:hypothetical protein